MTDRMKALTYELELLERSLADPDILSDPGHYREVMQRYSEVKTIVDVDTQRREMEKQLAGLSELLDDPDLAAEASREATALETRITELEAELEQLLLPRDPFDDKNVIVEIRAAAGGDEASLFAREMLEMYLKYAATLAFRPELLDSHPTEVGGLAKVSFSITGRGAYRAFKFESGVHRVQRVPATESQGRIHTSTVTVAVLPEAGDVDVALSAHDYRVDVYRSSGPGGQSVNTTDSAVRITFHPGQDDEIIVTCQDGKSQIKNKERALTVLRSRLLERERARAVSQAREARLVQIGTGDRSERIRTYNFPQSRITDHRIDFTTHDLSAVLSGDLKDLTSALQTEEQTRLALEAAQAPAGVQLHSRGAA